MVVAASQEVVLGAVHSYLKKSGYKKSAKALEKQVGSDAKL